MLPTSTHAATQFPGHPSEIFHLHIPLRQPRTNGFCDRLRISFVKRRERDKALSRILAAFVYRESRRMLLTSAVSSTRDFLHQFLALSPTRCDQLTLGFAFGVLCIFLVPLVLKCGIQRGFPGNENETKRHGGRPVRTSTSECPKTADWKMAENERRTLLPPPLPHRKR